MEEIAQGPMINKACEGPTTGHGIHVLFSCLMNISSRTGNKPQTWACNIMCFDAIYCFCGADACQSGRLEVAGQGGHAQGTTGSFYQKQRGRARLATCNPWLK